MLVDYEAASNDASYKMDIVVEFVNVSAPNSLTVKFMRTDSNRIIKRATYNVIVLNSTFMTSQTIARFTNSFEISFTSSTTFSLFTAQMANFNIPGNFLQNTKINDLCVIGFYRLKTNPILTNQVIFNATTTPIHGMNVYLESNSSTSSYYFNCSYRIFCLTSRNNAFYNSSTGLIQGCSANCISCDGLNDCKLCQSSYVNVNGSCFLCPSAYTNCIICSNITCLACSGTLVWDSSV